MCGRFSLTESIEAICKRFDAVFKGEDWHPRFNIAPAQEILTVVTDQTGNRVVTPMLWGLIPHWSKDRKIGYKMINARVETLKEKASYKKPFKKQRCLIPADGFYEWKKLKNRKSPMRVVMKDNSLFAMAGLWERWENKENGQTLSTFSIVTTEANVLLAEIHDRMPAILLPEDEERWLDSSLEDTVALEGMLQPYPPKKMCYYEVSPVVNSWKNDIEECINPVKK